MGWNGKSEQMTYKTSEEYKNTSVEWGQEWGHGHARVFRETGSGQTKFCELQYIYWKDSYEYISK